MTDDRSSGVAPTTVEGSVFDGKTAWLVNPCNQQPTLFWGSHVSEHIFRHAGYVVKQERLRAGHLALGAACITAGGSLHHHHIIHVAVLNAWSLDIRYLFGMRKRIGKDVLQTTFDSLLTIAQDHRIDMMDIPAFWLGKNGWEWDQFLETFGAHPFWDRAIIHRLPT